MRFLNPVRRCQSAVKRWRWFSAQKALILMYHRIAEETLTPNWLAVSPGNFDSHLSYLQKHCQPLHLLALVEALQKGAIPHRAVVVTFDDGYRDNLTQALPLLAAAKVPATIFVTTGFLDNQREFWWDDLARLLQSPGDIPPTLTLAVQGRTYQWDTATNKGRQAARLELDTLLAPLPEATKEELLAELARWSGLSRDVRPAYRTMTVAELTELVQSPLIAIGAHTVNHPLLSTLPCAEQAIEITESGRALAKLLGRPVQTFAYPNGDFTNETAQLVKSSGFCAACTTKAGYVQPGDDPFCLRRYGVNDWDAQTFAQKIEAWFQAA